MDYMTVQIVTPDGIRYDHRAAFILAKTTEGELGVYPGHIDLIAVLEIGEIKVRRIDDENHVDWIAVNGGIIEIYKNKINIISDSAERARDIDVSRAERAKLRAEREMEEAQHARNADLERRASIALQRAINRIQVGKH